MKTAIAIRHVHFENLGSFEQVLRDKGFSIQYLEATEDNLYQHVAEVDPELLVVLGGPIGVYETAHYPCLRQEIGVLQNRLAQKKPTLGICLGAQLIASALGSKVYSGGYKEIGWSPLTLSDAGKDSPLSFLGQAPTSVLHWHGDTFDLPEGAVHLASTKLCKNQAFSYGKNVLGLQFHAEVLANSIEAWLIGHACEIANAQGVTVNDLRADTASHAAHLEGQAKQFFAAWLEQVSLA
ncbi:glutamine amidotransferase [Paraherbaspirillum soli]|uniref:Glutamine amidotransferase n=1 Tax=Paraherbaspirillum soli TaxID=631222 RepID=A0ABW0M7R4_9BURK